MTSLKMLVQHKRFAPLFWTQFFGALNDNIFKNALVLIITFQSAQLWGMDSKSLVSLAGGIFILPFFLFSPISGQLCDRYQRSTITRWVKIWELIIMLMAALGFFLESMGLLMLVLFLLGVQSTLFGPIKYSTLPDLLEKDDLMAGNALVEFGTFMAILIGTIGGGMLISTGTGWVSVVWVTMVVALLGIWGAFKMPKVSVADSQIKIKLNPFPECVRLWKILREEKSVFHSVLAISWFWFVGAGILTILPSYCRDLLRADESVVTTFLALFTVGIGTGSLLCAKLSFQRVETGFVPFGSLGMTLSLIGMYFFNPSWGEGELWGLSHFLSMEGSVRILLTFFMMSVFSGFYIVPLYAFIQERSRPSVLSRVIAGCNIVNALFMVIVSVAIILFYQLSLSYPEIILILAVLNIFVMIYLYFSTPEFFRRCYSWILARISHKIP